jgi:hypothetical protein
MRTLMKVTIPVDHGNSSIEQGTLPLISAPSKGNAVV